MPTDEDDLTGPGAGPRHDPSAYGEATAADYDALTAALVGDTDAAVATLAELADGGPVLELGVGTGRLALPLVARAWRSPAWRRPRR